MLWLRLARMIVRCYPAQWRRLYERELLALVDDAPATPRVVLDLLIGALRERGAYRAAAWTARLFGRIAWSWVVAVAAVAALWVLFVLGFALIGQPWFGFDRWPWIGERLLDTRRVVLPLTSFYLLPSLIFALPAILLLFVLGAKRRPVLARVGVVASFMIFSAWWDRTLFFSDRNPIWNPEFGHFGALIFGWLMARRLFPTRFERSADAASAHAAGERSDDSKSSPRMILRLNFEPTQ